MNRRKFLKFSVGSLSLSMIPMKLNAINYHEKKPEIWKIKKVDDAIKEVFGSNNTIDGEIELKAPSLAANGGNVVIKISTKLNAKTIAIFQDTAPIATIAVISVPKRSIPNYSLNIKMCHSGNIITVVEADDGKLYKTSKFIDVALNGC